MRAALPQIVERSGHVVVISSVYAFMNGVLNSPYAVAKAGVESMGRALRTELTPLGASASVAYFGWVDTKMVQDADRPAGLEPAPGKHSRVVLLKRIPPRRGGRGDRRAASKLGAPRIFAPKWWRYVSALRGILNPLLDRRMEQDRRMVAAVLEVEADADEQGAAAVAAASRLTQRG